MVICRKSVGDKGRSLSQSPCFPMNRRCRRLPTNTSVKSEMERTDSAPVSLKMREVEQPHYHFTSKWSRFKAAFRFNPAEPTSLDSRWIQGSNCDQRRMRGSRREILLTGLRLDAPRLSLRTAARAYLDTLSHISDSASRLSGASRQIRQTGSPFRCAGSSDRSRRLHRGHRLVNR
jgi:hypothetical protein